ncbi:MAG: hypothetical protein PQJ46_01510 [Spirochaetales bacterium]|nr:hypothetical protein [Spirochaetales bacterium]
MKKIFKSMVMLLIAMSFFTSCLCFPPEPKHDRHNEGRPGASRQDPSHKPGGPSDRDKDSHGPGKRSVY